MRVGIDCVGGTGAPPNWMPLPPSNLAHRLTYTHIYKHTTATVEPVAQVAQAARPSNAPTSAGSRVNKDAESLLRCVVGCWVLGVGLSWGRAIGGEGDGGGTRACCFVPTYTRTGTEHIATRSPWTRVGTGCRST